MPELPVGGSPCGADDVNSALLRIAHSALRWKRARIAIDRREVQDLEELWAARVELCLRIGEWLKEEEEGHETVESHAPGGRQS